jgi:ABC-type multidrug transport system fused ATPase/permease subunit
MSPPTETTPLRGTPQPSRWYIVPYSFLLLLFLLCNFFAFIPQAFLSSAFLPDDFATLQLCMLVVVDFVIDMTWPSLGHVLEYAGSIAIFRQQERSKRRAIRKSESLNALAKALLRFISIFSTIRLASEQLGLIFILPAVVYLVMTAAFTSAFLMALSQAQQNRKAKRDDAV